MTEDLLNEFGYDAKKLQDRYEAKDFEVSESTAKLKALRDRHRILARAGIDHCYESAMAFSAIDKAFDASQSQLTPTILRSLRDADPTTAINRALLDAWNLKDYLVTDTKDGIGIPKNPKNPQIPRLNIPDFFNVFVPLVAAYVTVRWAKLWSIRDGVPIYPYSPITPSVTGHLVCQVITNEMEKQSSEMGYRSIERHADLCALLYGHTFVFSKSPYLKQETYVTKTEKKTVKEGVPFVVTHPTKSFCDTQCPMESFNTDTGGTFAGYWSMMPVGGITGGTYWNKASIAKMTGSRDGWFNKEGLDLYSHFYPCVSYVPASGMITENSIENAPYRAGVDDQQQVQIVTIFEKVVPKDLGLFDLDIPIWVRWMYAGGNGACIDCTPFLYNPISVSQYNHDPNRLRHTSLAYEIVPFQDMVSNQLMQHLLSMRQNLKNITLYNSECISAETLKLINQRNDSGLREFVLAPFKLKAVTLNGAQPGNLFYPVALPKHNLGEIISSIDLTLRIMERVLGFSQNEVGQSASHELSSNEVSVIDSGSSARVELTNSFLQDGRNARQMMVLKAWLAYSQKEIEVEISGITPDHKKALEDMGFDVKDIGLGTMRITGKKGSIGNRQFTSQRMDADRVPDAKTGTAMLQALQTLASNPLIFQSLGPKFVVMRFNQILSYLGLPSDWRLDHMEDKNGDPQQQQAVVQAITEALKQYDAQLQQALKAGVVEPMKKAIGELQAGQQQAGQVIQGIGQGIQQVAARMQQDEQQIAVHDKVMQGITAHIAQVDKELQAVATAIAHAVQPPGPPQQLPPQQMPPPDASQAVDPVQQAVLAGGQ